MNPTPAVPIAAPETNLGAIAALAQRVLLDALKHDGVECISALSLAKRECPRRVIKIKSTDSKDWEQELAEALEALVAEILQDSTRNGSKRLGTMLLPVPSGMEGIRLLRDGLALRVLKQFDVDSGSYRVAFDIFYNWL